MRKKGFYESISKIIISNVDIVTFNQKINDFTVDKILESTKTDEIDLFSKLTTLSNEIYIFLQNIHSAILEIDNLSKRNDYDFIWISAGKNELRDIMTYLNLLELNINQSLSLVDELNVPEGDQFLDKMNDICNVILGIKKTFQPVQKRIAVINHHYELKEGIIESVKNEISGCLEKLSELKLKNTRLDIISKISDTNLMDFVRLKKLYKSKTLTGQDFILFSDMDIDVFDDYTSIHDTLSPIAESLNLIPITLDEFCKSAKETYKDLVIQNLTSYENTVESFNRFRTELKDFKNKYVVKRITLICDRIFQLLETPDYDSTENIETALTILKPLANLYDMDKYYVQRLIDFEKRLTSRDLQENIPQTPAHKVRVNNPKSIRKFSNPLTETLNMKPVLSESNQNMKENKKLFQTPKLIDEHVFSKSNIEYIERVKTEILEDISDEIHPPHTPSADNSFSSSNSSPDAMTAKNIFDSPNPFITPNSRNFGKTSKSLMTPLTTPRPSLTQKYVMLPIDEEPQQITRLKYNKSKPNENKNQQIPLLRFELSTVIKTTETSDDNEREDTNPIPTKNLLSTSKIPINNPKCRTKIVSPNTSHSRIPLPSRPESRLSLQRSSSRSSSRSQSRQDNLKISPTIHRPESRLENLAFNISSKLGTISPIAPTTEIKPRPSTVMTQREMKLKREPLQPSRLLNRYPSELRNIKVRGTTSLGTRKQFGANRITSV